jgi:hypothetical protein
MRDVFNQLLGSQGGPVIQMIGALLVVVVLIVLFAWVMRRLGGGQRKQPARRGERVTQRLAVVDAAHVDGQRRLVLVRRDDVEHLVMIGGPNDVLIEPRIVRGQPLGGQRAAPQAIAPMVAPVVAPTHAPAPPQSAPSPVMAQQPPPSPRPVQPTQNPPVLTPVNTADSLMAAPMPPQGQVPMPPPFIEPVPSPAVGARANPVAADLRAAMTGGNTGGSGRREDDLVDTQRGYAQRVAPPAPMPLAQPFPAPVPPARPNYEEPTIAAPRPAYGSDQTGYASGRGPTSPPRPTAYERQAQQQPAPVAPAGPVPMSLEDMVTAGLEQAIARPEPTGRNGGRQAGPAFGQRVEPAQRPVAPPQQQRDRGPAKDAMAAEIERAISGLTAAPSNSGLGRQTGEPPRPIAYQPPARPVAARPEPQPIARPVAPESPAGRLPQATTPNFARQPHIAAPVRPTLVANQEQPAPEPVVAVMPQPDNLRADLRADGTRRSSSEIEDEMARLLSELTGTSGR